MPLMKGRSNAVKSANIRELVKSGRPVKQAVAIAYRKANEARLPRPPRKPKMKDDKE